MHLTIIIPTYNEHLHIEDSLNSILTNDWDFSDTEILISDGGSNDGTREILDKFKSSHSFITILSNSQKKQVYALNQMIAASTGNYIIRCDAHSIYPRSYIKSLVTQLESDSELGNVGLPVMTVSADSSIKATAISKALQIPAGVGVSHRNLLSITTPTLVDTLLFGAWPREIFSEVGLFDEGFIRGQDYEHNMRVKKAGRKVMVIPGEPLRYLARSNYTQLSKMIYQYASCKPQVIKKHSELPNIRSLIPLFFYLTLFFSIFISSALTAVILITYLSFIVISSIKTGERATTVKYIVTSLFIMHASHAAGTFYGFIYYILLKKQSKPWDHSR